MPKDLNEMAKENEVIALFRDVVIAYKKLTPETQQFVAIEILLPGDKRIRVDKSFERREN